MKQPFGLKRSARGEVILFFFPFRILFIFYRKGRCPYCGVGSTQQLWNSFCVERLSWQFRASATSAARLRTCERKCFAPQLLSFVVCFPPLVRSDTRAKALYLRHLRHPTSSFLPRWFSEENLEKSRAISNNRTKKRSVSCRPSSTQGRSRANRLLLTYYYFDKTNVVSFSFEPCSGTSDVFYSNWARRAQLYFWLTLPYSVASKATQPKFL